MPRKLGEVFYELELKNDQFNAALTKADKSIESFVAGGGAKLTTFTATIGAAMLATAYKATQMAATIDTAMRKVAAASPAAVGGMSKLRGAIEDIAAVSPRTHEALAEGAALIAKIGGGTAEEISARLQSAVRIADAAGTDLNSTIEAMDFTMDAFGLNVQEASDALAKMFAITRGKIDMEDLFTVLQRGGTTLATLGVKADDAATALTALVDAGTPTRQAGTVLISILDQLDQAGKISASASDEQKRAARELLNALSPAHIAAKGLTGAITDLAKAAHSNANELRAMGFGSAEADAILRVTAATTHDTRTEAEKLADAYRQVNEAAGLNNGSAAALAQILKNQLVTTLVELGTQVLPAVTAELRGLVGLIDLLSGHSARVVGNDAAIRSIETITASLNKLDPAGRARDIKRLREAIEQIAGDSPARPLSLGTLSSDELKALQKGLATYIQNEAPGLARQMIAENMRAIGEELQKRGALTPAAATTTPDKKKPGSTTVTGLSPDELKKLQEQRAAVIKAAEDTAVQLTKTAQDDLQLALDRFQHDVERAFGKNVPKVVRDALVAMKQQVDATPILEGLADQFDELSSRANTAAALTASGYAGASRAVLAEVQGLIEKTQRQLALAKEGSSEQSKLVEQLKKERDLRDKITTELAAAESEREKSRISLKAVAQAIDASVRGALQLGDAFGIVSTQTANVLSNIAQVAANIPGLLDAANRLGKIDLGDLSQVSNAAAGGANFGAIASAALPVLGGIAALIGPALAGNAAANAETKRIQQQNTEALRKLADVIGEFSLSITGRDFSKGSLGTTTALGLLQTGGISFDVLSKVSDVSHRLDNAMSGLGVSMDDVRKLAGELGIALDERNVVAFADSLKKLQEAIQHTELTQFAESFQGQMEALQASFKLFDISDPIAQLKALLKVLSDPKTGAPAIAQALGGLDLTTPEGRAAAETAIQQLFTALQNGTFAATYGNSALGGLTPEEFLQQLLQIKDLLDSGQAAAGDTGTGGYNVDRTITEATGSHIAGLLTSANVFAARTADATELIASVLRGTAPVAIQPPAISQGAAGSGSGTIVLNINIGALPAGMTTGQATQLGQAIGDAAADSVNRKLGREYKARQLLAGRVTLNPKLSS